MATYVFLLNGPLCEMLSVMAFCSLFEIAKDYNGRFRGAKPFLRFFDAKYSDLNKDSLSPSGRSITGFPSILGELLITHVRWFADAPPTKATEMAKLLTLTKPNALLNAAHVRNALSCSLNQVER